MRRRCTSCCCESSKETDSPRSPYSSGSNIFRIVRISLTDKGSWILRNSSGSSRSRIYRPVYSIVRRLKLQFRVQLGYNWLQLGIVNAILHEMLSHMRLPATTGWSLLFVAYALAVWVTAYHGLHGSDSLGLVCALLLLGGVVILVYLGFLRRTVQPGLYSAVAPIGLGLLGLGLGTMSSGEAGIGITAGLVIGGATAIATAAVRRRRRPKTLFLSYRRADSSDITPRIRDRLAQRFGDKNIFMDLDSIELGAPFRQVLSDAVNHSDALVAIIGERWLDLKDDDGRRRIDKEEDLVRIEIETALRNKKVLVVPIAVKGATIPEPAELPENIRDLASRNGGVVRDRPEFESDMSRLIFGLEQGSVTPWSRAAPTPIPWRWVVAMVAILLTPLPWFLLEDFTHDYRAMNSAELSPNRAMVATAHGSGIGVKSRVRIWDANTGELLHTLRAGEGPVWTVAWSPDGKHLAYGDHDGTLALLNTNTWEERHRFQQHSGMVKQIGWEPGGHRIATGDQNGAIRVWNLHTGDLRFTARSHTDNVEMIQWAPVGDRIASASWDRTTTITDGSTGELLYRIEGYTSHVNCVAWSHDGTMLASGSLESPYVAVWDASEPRMVTQFVGHKSSVEALAWSPTAPLLASAGRDRTIRIWSAAGAVKHVFDVGGIGSPRISWSPDGTLVAAADDERLWIWEVQTGRRLSRFEAHEDDYEIRILGWWPDSRHLATRGRLDDAVKVWEVYGGRQITTVRIGVIQALKDMAF
jgi:WD40 repeat protein